MTKLEELAKWAERLEVRCSVTVEHIDREECHGPPFNVRLLAIDAFYSGEPRSMITLKSDSAGTAEEAAAKILARLTGHS